MDASSRIDTERYARERPTDCGDRCVYDARNGEGDSLRSAWGPVCNEGPWDMREVWTQGRIEK